MGERFGPESATGAGAAASTAFACLAMVARMQGVGMALDPLAAPPGELTAETLVALADRAGLRCRPLTLAWAKIITLGRALPAIVQLRDGRSHVLCAIADEAGTPHAVLIDPEAPDEVPLRLDRRAFERLCSGEVLLVKRSLGVAPDGAPFGPRDLAALVAGERRLLRDLVLSALVMGVLALAPILVAALLVGDVMAVQARDTFVFLCGGAAILAVFEAAFAAVRLSLVTRLSVRLGLRLDAMLFDRMLALPITVFETTPAGLIARRIARGAALGRSLATPLVVVLLDAGLLLVFLPAMVHISLLLTIVAGAVAAIAGLATIPLLPRHRRATVALIEAEGDSEAFLARTIESLRAIKTLALDARHRRRWDELVARIARLRLARGHAADAVGMVARLFDGLLVFGTFALGAALALDPASSLSRASLFAFLLMTWRLSGPLRHLGPLVGQWHAARAAADAVLAFAGEPIEPSGGTASLRTPLRGQIDFIGVDFSYPEATTTALRAVSFTVPAGTTLGIMGRSGAGKSTIARLLQRLHPDYVGLIKLDGIDLRQYDLDHLRRSVCVVGQDGHLFPGTIGENILAARPEAGPAAMVRAARLVRADAFIDRLPLGYDTPLGEGAAILSDGQRQAVAIARALAADPRILVLDEATAALDADTEAALLANLRRAGGDRTVIVIAQRLAVLRRADAILVLDRGEVADIGHHHELIERSDIYAGLWQRQTARLAPPTPVRRLTRDAHVA